MRLNQIELTCDWCGKVWMAEPSRRRPTFTTCSHECRAKAMAVYMKEKWGALTPEERTAWRAKLGKGDHAGQGLIDYHKGLRPDRVKKVIEMMSTPIGKTRAGGRYHVKGKSGKANPRLDGEEWMPKGTCTLIAAHHEMLKDDPERLTTAFMEKMCEVDCKCKIKKKEEKM